MIDSEESLSKKFDEFMQGSLDSSEECICDYGEDEVALSEDFSNWADGLCSEGEIHPKQYESYSYVGKWS